ncbi:MAG: Na/Pi symporter [Cyclobacteriaceae bacterium]
MKNREDLSTSNIDYVFGVFAILIFFLSINLISTGASILGKDTALSILSFASNPFMAMFLGILTTVILQSSSTTTTLIVALVASNSLTLNYAIPMVMGANIGTTITSTIVSLSYMTRPDEFRKAIAAASVHDFFNIIIVSITLPLELKYGLLSKLSKALTAQLNLSYSNNSSYSGITSLSQPVIDFLAAFLNPIAIIVLGFFLLLLAIKLFAKVLYKRIFSGSNRLGSLFFGNKFKTFGFGLLSTSLIQSSSLLTSLMVPVVVGGKMKLREAFHFILGANLGTTVTALIGALFQSEAALSLALVHCIFNVVGVAIFLITPLAERLPIFLAERLGFFTFKNRLVGFIYILSIFFLIPALLIFLV